MFSINSIYEFLNMANFKIPVESNKLPKIFIVCPKSITSTDRSFTFCKVKCNVEMRFG